jgi:hypothetical protein
MSTTKEPTPPRKALYRVSPVDGGWVIELAGDSVREHAIEKGEAIARARKLAEEAPIGAVAVYDRDGRLEREFDVEHVRAN